MSHPVCHYSDQKMHEIFGCRFEEYVQQGSDQTDPGQIIDRAFFKPAEFAVHRTDDGGVLNASLNPVAPCHVLAFPSPETTGTRHENGEWRNIPGDGDFLSISKNAVAAAFHALFDWTVSGFYSAPEMHGMAGLKQSFWTANLGRSARLAVPWLHIHHLMTFEESAYTQFQKHDPRTARFIRPINVRPETLLRQAYDDKHGYKSIDNLQRNTPFISVPDNQERPDSITVTRPQHVKTNDFAVELALPESGISFSDIKAMTETAYEVQRQLQPRGVTGYTMVMDSTALQRPLRDQSAGKLSMYFVAHMNGDPEWLRGGFVYTAQKYTAPAKRDLQI